MLLVGYLLVRKIRVLISIFGIGIALGIRKLLVNCYLVCILHVPVEVATRIWLTSYVFAAILQGVLIFTTVVGFHDLDYTKIFHGQI